MAAWSFSALKVFETCPRKYHAEKVKKLYPFKETPAIKYGKYVHKACEEYVKDGVPLPKDIAHFEPQLLPLREKEGEKICEQKVALTEDLQETTYFSKKVWLRAAADLLILRPTVAFVVDYKTGKDKYPDMEQLEVMALMIFALYPAVETVHGSLLFLKSKNHMPRKFTREDDFDRLEARWRAKVKRLDEAFENDVWPPNPNGLCSSYCPVEYCEYQGE